MMDPIRKALALAAALALAGPLGAASVDLRLGAGPYTGLAGLAASVDLGSSGRWSLDGDVNVNTVTRTAVPDQSTDAALKLGFQGRALNGSLGLDGYTDTRSAVSMGGLTLGGGWTWHRPGGRDDADPGAERLAVGLELGLHTYKVDLGGNTRLAYVEGGQSLPVNAKGELNLTQLAPGLSVELPLFGGALNPSASYTRYFYSSDATLVADEVEQGVLLGPGAGRVQSAVAQFYRQAWSLGLSAPLPWSLSLSATWARQQLVSSGGWMDTPNATLAAELGQHWDAHLTWSATIDQGAMQPQGELGVGFRW
jgi:hypothetical protein